MPTKPRPLVLKRPVKPYLSEFQIFLNQSFHHEGCLLQNACFLHRGLYISCRVRPKKPYKYHPSEGWKVFVPNISKAANLKIFYWLVFFLKKYKLIKVKEHNLKCFSRRFQSFSLFRYYLKGKNHDTYFILQETPLLLSV